MITQWRQEVRMEEALPSAPALWGRGRLSAHIKGGGDQKVQAVARSSYTTSWQDTRFTYAVSRSCRMQCNLGGEIHVTRRPRTLCIYM